MAFFGGTFLVAIAAFEAFMYVMFTHHWEEENKGEDD